MSEFCNGNCIICIQMELSIQAQKFMKYYKDTHLFKIEIGFNEYDKSENKIIKE